MGMRNSDSEAPLLQQANSVEGKASSHPACSAKAVCLPIITNAQLMAIMQPLT